MQTKIIEATNGPRNHGKFIVMRPDKEWRRRSTLEERPEWLAPSLLTRIGWGRDHVIVFDLQTNEGATFLPGGSATADLYKHRVWVCPLFEPFLAWLYEQDLRDLEVLPDHVDLPDAPFDYAGYRRPGRVDD